MSINVIYAHLHPLRALTVNENPALCLSFTRKDHLIEWTEGTSKQRDNSVLAEVFLNSWDDKKGELEKNVQVSGRTRKNK